jgi:hypothetical protein
MNRSEMLKNLHELDKKLWTALDIEICGASAAILKNALKRSSIDIDVVKASYPLDDPKLRKVLDEILYIPNDLPSWLNSNAEKSIFGVLPKTYEFDRERIAGESFGKLNPKLISNADFIICKLSIEEQNLRSNDYPDVKNLVISIKDVERFYEKINKLSRDNQALSLKMEGIFKQLRPEHAYNEEKMPFSNGQDIANYSLKRYGITNSKSAIEQWNDDIINMIKKPAIIVGEIDYKAGQEIENGNKRFAGKDREYRAQLKKVVDHGMDL